MTIVMTRQYIIILTLTLVLVDACPFCARSLNLKGTSTIRESNENYVYEFKPKTINLVISLKILIKI